MKLGALLEQAGLGQPEGTGDREVRSVSEDSRRIAPGTVFVAIGGLRTHGARYVRDALGRGAVAVVAERQPAGMPEGIPWIPSPAPRRSLALLARALHGDAPSRLKLTAVTGTKGKTTTAVLIRAIALEAGQPMGLVGTLGSHVGERFSPPGLTTPTAPELHALFAEMVEAGERAAVMEVSSHAIAQERVHGLTFETALFTNLFPDHQDYHSDLEDYFQTKRRLFVGAEQAETALINVSDAHGKRLVEDRPDAVLFGEGPAATVRLGPVEASREGTRVGMETQRGSLEIHSALLGSYNAWNLLAAAAWGVSRQCTEKQILTGLEHVRSIPGRMEPVEASPGLLALVDFSHTGPALSSALLALAPLTDGRIIVVFGCGGNRDRERRVSMGRVASELADVAVITSDNPRDEDPLEIVSAIETAARAAAGPAELVVEPDREAAIHRAVQLARQGDTLLVAGRGHETHQLIGSRRIPFDDREVLREALRKRKLMP